MKFIKINQARIFVILLIGIFFSYTKLSAQVGKISGKVISTKGEELMSAIIYVEGTDKGAQSDYAGMFTIANLKPGKYKLNIKYVGFDNASVENVEVLANKTTTVNIVLSEKTTQIDEVTIKAKAKKESANALLITQKNAVSVSDGISSETIKRSPDKSTSDILKRVSGASIQDNKFAIIRGLNERYNSAFLNGAPLPSSETDRKAFAFDIFPSNMLDNLIITKTATPDQTGEFAGGIITINTKNIPDENFQSISLGSSYNAISTFKNSISYRGGKTDFLGLDDGIRDTPKGIPGLNAWPTSREEKANAARLFPNDWSLKNTKCMPGASFQYTLGRAYKNKAKDKDIFGFMFSLTYNNSPSISTNTLYDYDQGDGNALMTNLKDDTYSTKYLLGSILNFTYKPGKNNTISFKNIYSINSEDRVVVRNGQVQVNSVSPTTTYSNVLWFTSNQIYSGQLIGEHFLTGPKLKIGWIVSNSDIKRLIPGLRRMVYNSIDGGPLKANIEQSASFLPTTAGTYFYAVNNETIRNAQFDISTNFNFSKKIKNTVKFGLYLQHRVRDFNSRKLNMAQNAISGGSLEFEDSLTQLDQSKIFSPQNIGLLENGKGGFLLEQIINPYDAYGASSDIFARYIMFDSKIGPRFRAVFGVRLETFYLKLNSIKDNREPVNINTVKSDYLPSINIVESLSEKQNLRFSFSQTVNRPEFRELSPFLFYDFTTRYQYSGNDTLVRCKITNYDLRYEFFPGRNQLLSASLFYKSFEKPIEQKSNPNGQRDINFLNAYSATNYGFEIEFRVMLAALFAKKEHPFLEKFTAYTNFAYIESRVIVSSTNKTLDRDRRLQGQSPYIINSGAMYQDFKSGTTVSLSLNRVGDRIYIVGDINNPTLYEKGRTAFDIQISKNLYKNKLELRLNMKDIFHQNLIFYYDQDFDGKYSSNKDLVVMSRNFGTEFSVSGVYKF